MVQERAETAAQTSREALNNALAKAGFSKAYSTTSSFGISAVSVAYCKGCGTTILLSELEHWPLHEHPLTLHMIYCPARQKEEA